MIVLVPALNEEKTVGAVVKAFSEFRSELDIQVHVIVDPHTTDYTTDEARSSGAVIIKSPVHGKGQGVNHAIRILEFTHATDFVFCDADVTLSYGAVRELLLPLGRNTGQRVIVPRWPTLQEWDKAEADAGLKFNMDSWLLVSGIRRVRRDCIPDDLYGYVMETQINRAVATAGLAVERMYSHDTISPLRFTPQRVEDLLAHGKVAKERGLI